MTAVCNVSVEARSLPSNCQSKRSNYASQATATSIMRVPQTEPLTELRVLVRSRSTITGAWSLPAAMPSS